MFSKSTLEPFVSHCHITFPAVLPLYTNDDIVYGLNYCKHFTIFFIWSQTFCNSTLKVIWVLFHTFGVKWSRLSLRGLPLWETFISMPFPTVFILPSYSPSFLNLFFGGRGTFWNEWSRIFFLTSKTFIVCLTSTVTDFCIWGKHIRRLHLAPCK